MTIHKIEYDDQGIAQNEPWALGQYLMEDGFSAREEGVIVESVLSWLKEFSVADCPIEDAIAELEGL